VNSAAAKAHLAAHRPGVSHSNAMCGQQRVIAWPQVSRNRATHPPIALPPVLSADRSTERRTRVDPTQGDLQ